MLILLNFNVYINCLIINNSKSQLGLILPKNFISLKIFYKQHLQNILIIYFQKTFS